MAYCLTSFSALPKCQNSHLLKIFPDYSIIHTPSLFLHSSITLITIRQTVLLTNLSSIPTSAQCQFSPLHFQLHESRALFCSLFSGVPGTSMMEWMKCKLQITVEKIFFSRLNSTSMISNKDSEFRGQCYLKATILMITSPVLGLPFLRRLPSCSKSVSVLYTPNQHPNSSCSCLPSFSASEW